MVIPHVTNSRKMWMSLLRPLRQFSQFNPNKSFAISHAIIKWNWQWISVEFVALPEPMLTHLCGTSYLNELTTNLDWFKHLFDIELRRQLWPLSQPPMVTLVQFNFADNTPVPTCVNSYIPMRYGCRTQCATFRHSGDGYLDHLLPNCLHENAKGDKWRKRNIGSSYGMMAPGN